MSHLPLYTFQDEIPVFRDSSSKKCKRLSRPYEGWLRIFAILLVGICFSCFSLVASFATEGKRDEYLLKSAFMERFTRFITWPEPFDEKNEDAPFVLGLIGPNPFGDILSTVFSKQPIKGHPVEIRFLNHLNEISGCHLLFIGPVDDTTLSDILSISKYDPILTLSDTKGYASKGVHINMSVVDKQIRFEINHEAIIDSGLQISYLLLNLATIVKRNRGEN